MPSSVTKKAETQTEESRQLMKERQSIFSTLLEKDEEKKKKYDNVLRAIQYICEKNFFSS
jgi:hypothetical protein